MAVCLEERYSDCYGYIFHDDLQAFLQIYMSIGGCLFCFQSHCGITVPGGKRNLHRMRRLCESLQNAGESGGEPESSGMYPLRCMQEVMSGKCNTLK